MYFEILNKNQKQIFRKLTFIKKFKFYLGGGTAIAFYLKHRTSADFDFFTSEKFKTGDLAIAFRENILEENFKIIRDFDNIFEIVFQKNVRLSCFYYPYFLLNDLIDVKGINVASLDDLAGMKVVSIAQRGNFRDFIDIYYLIQKYGLKEILEIAKKKYPEFDVYYGLKGLLYFADAEKDKDIRRIRVFDKNLKWKNVKNYIISQVKTFEKTIHI